MTGTRVSLNLHGRDLHQLVLAMATIVANERGYTMLDDSWFKSKLIKAEPDVYFEVTWHFNGEDGKRVNGVKRYVVEVESHPSKASIDLKMKQFQTTSIQHELIVIDLESITKKQQESVKELWALVRRRMP